MKAKCKFIVLLITMLILTGCTSTANITINNDYSVDENIKIIFDNSKTTNYDTPKKYAQSYLEYYSPAIKYKDYQYNINEGNNSSNVEFTKSTNGICKSINNNLFSQYLYKFINCEEDSTHILIKSEGNQLISLPQSEKSFDIESLILNIKLPVSAEENDADDVNNNTYTWRFDATSQENKSVYLKVSKKALKQAKTKAEAKKKIDNNINVIIKIVIVIIVLFIIGVIANLFYKKYKNNRVEY